jgi:hypothetical protein
LRVTSRGLGDVYKRQIGDLKFFDKKDLDLSPTQIGQLLPMMLETLRKATLV